MNKKAQLSDMVFVLVTLVSLAITMVVAGYVFLSVGESLQESNLMNGTVNDTYYAFEPAFPMFDTGFAFVLFGLIIGLVISAFLIPSHPVFVVINIIGFGVLVFLGAVFSNLYETLITTSSLNASALAYYPITTFIMQYFPWLGAGIVLIVSVIMYAKTQ